MAALSSDLDPDDMLAAINKWKTKFNRGGAAGARRDTRPRRDTAPRREANPRAAGDRPARRCPNCGETHADRKCPKPSVAFGDRTCWTCGKKNHTSAQCPDKPLRAIEDGSAGPLKALSMGNSGPLKLNGCFAVTDDGFVAPNPRRTSRITRPLPTQTTLASYIYQRILGTY
jgi:hypothetical protein